jgi:xanthine dehydrogenase accessory factor
MNHWKETADIFSRLDTLAAERRKAALATVVRVAGSAYRRPGAKLLVTDSGDTLGGVSGGCLETDVREVARVVIDTQVPSLLRYNAGDDDAVGGLGLGCNGLVTIVVQPASSGSLGSLLETVRVLLEGDAPLALATVIADGVEVGATMAIALRESDLSAPIVHGSLGSADLDQQVVECAVDVLADGHSGVHVVAGRQVFIEALIPPPHLLVCGAGADAIPLVGYAGDVGFRVTVLDHREALLTEAAFPGASRRAVAQADDPELTLPPPARSLAVVMTHSLARDRDWVRLLAGMGVPYIGVLGPKERTETIVREVCGHVAAPGVPGRVFGPVGLDLGADGPHQVAISIVAELLAVTAKREPRHLWQRRQPIHSE